MSCEKQFLSADNAFLYCSEACRIHDQASSYTRAHSTTTPNSPPQSPYARHFSSLPNSYFPDEGPDIIPRFSPTQSRPRSYYSSDPYASYQVPSSPTARPQYADYTSSTALASLRELATALPRTDARRAIDPESPPRTGSGVWNHMSFTTGSRSAQSTPGTSYSNTQAYNVSQSYSGAYSNGYAGRKEDVPHGGKSYGAAAGWYGNTGGMGMDRPLPPRSGPGYGHRPRSIDLVTPL